MVRDASNRAVVLHDDEQMLALAEGILVREGFEVRVTSSAFRAIEIAAEGPAQLVLLGLGAVDSRDLELVSLLRARWPSALLVVLFPAGLRARAAQALDMGADAYIPEPCYPGEIASLARRARGARDATGPVTGGVDGFGDGPPTTDPVEKLAAGVAHTVRNPLQILELLRGGVEAGEDLDTQEMKDQIRRIADVVEELTRFAATASSGRSPVDVNELAERGFSGGAVRFELALCDGPAQVTGSPEALIQALQLLRTRAERLTPAGGTVRVATRRVDGAVELEVTDGGPVPTAAELAEFFEPSGEESAVQDGTWLEMAAVAGIVRSHGGRADVAAGGNMGTRILVRLPSRPPGGAPDLPAS